MQLRDYVAFLKELVVGVTRVDTKGRRHWMHSWPANRFVAEEELAKAEANYFAAAEQAERTGMVAAAAEKPPAQPAATAPDAAADAAAAALPAAPPMRKRRSSVVALVRRQSSTVALALAAAAEAAVAEATAGEGGDADVAKLAAGVAAEQAARPATATRPLTSTSTRPATATGVGRCDEAQSRGASQGRGAGSSGVFGGLSPIFPAERSPGCDWRSGEWPAVGPVGPAGPAGSRAFPKVSGQRRPLSSRARAGRADGANLMPNRGAAEGAVGLKGFSPPASRPQFAVDYQPKLSTTSPKHAMGISLLAGGGTTWSNAAPR